MINMNSINEVYFMEQVTYGALKKPVVRENALKQGVVKLGTKAGNYGKFKEQARVVSNESLRAILSELRYFEDGEGLDESTIINSCPEIFKLLSEI